MSAPGIARITGFENGVWTVPPSLTDRLRRKFTGFKQANANIGQEDMTMREAADYIDTLEASVSLVSSAYPTGAETPRQINPQSTKTVEIELGSLAILNRLAQWAALKNGENIIIDGIDLTNINNWGDCLHELLVDTIAHIRALEAENHDLRTDITIMGNVLDDYVGRR